MNGNERLKETIDEAKKCHSGCTSISCELEGIDFGSKCDYACALITLVARNEQFEKQINTIREHVPSVEYKLLQRLERTETALRLIDQILWFRNGSSTVENFISSIDRVLREWKEFKGE